MTNQELDDRLAELLVGYQLVTPSLLERARTFQATRGETLAAALSNLQVVPPETLARLLEELTGVRSVDPSLMTVYADFIDRINLLIPPAVVAGLRVFPAQAEINAIHVCMPNPTDGWTARALESISGCPIVPLVSVESAIVSAIQRHYARYGQAPNRSHGEDARREAERVYRELLAAPFEEYLKPAVSLVNRSRDALLRDPAALESLVREPILIRLVQQILCRAVEAGASDVHVEPMTAGLQVRARIDGTLRLLHTLPAAATVPIVGRIKAMAELPIHAASEPLDARIGCELAWGRAIELRFSLIPSVTGEKVVLRVLDRSRERKQLVDLGMDDETRAVVEAAAALPNGLMLVTGPTGSGKSSTLYALLDHLSAVDACILTAEDPVESRIAGATQVQCSEASGVTFATALRSFLRQDPDILMVGEIRDAETADIALKAALTGHLVLSSLHTNDAPGAVLRLLNMNLEPFLIASSLRLVVAQRLVRRLCPGCRRPVRQGSEHESLLLAALTPVGRRLVRGAVIWEPAGCPACQFSGYRGRVGIFEALRISERIEELIVARASTGAIRACARQEGMRTLREDGLLKVARGETSIAEIVEHTVADTDEAAGVPVTP
jgi:type IV pilus assembly protein PilB